MMFVYLSLLIVFLIVALVTVVRLSRPRRTQARASAPVFILPPESGARGGVRLLPSAMSPTSLAVSDGATPEMLVRSDELRARFAPTLLQLEEDDFGTVMTWFTQRRLDSTRNVIASAKHVTRELGELRIAELDCEIQARARLLHLKYQEEIARLDFELERAETEFAVETIRAKQRDLMSRIAELQRIGVVSR